MRAHRRKLQRSNAVEPLELANLFRSVAAGSPIRPWASNERAKKAAPWLSAKSDQSEFFRRSPWRFAYPGSDALRRQFVWEVLTFVRTSVQIEPEAADCSITTSGLLCEPATTPSCSAAHGTPACRTTCVQVWTSWSCQSLVRAPPETYLQLKLWSP